MHTKYCFYEEISAASEFSHSLAYEGTLAVEGFHRLYEQKQTAPERAAALDDYLTRWVRWVYGSLAPLNGA